MMKLDTIRLINLKTNVFGGHSELAPPLPISNRTVKRLSADDSVVPHVKVGRCQTNYSKKRPYTVITL